MIPKIIHYCWFGGNPLPEFAIKCIESWKKYCPDYEIKEWNESNFDIESCDYIREAYEAKKWAFVSDYARFVILYKYGGIYFDTDVELVKSLDEIVNKGAFMACEKHSGRSSVLVAPGLGLGATSGMPIYKDIIDHYENSYFIDENGVINTETVVVKVTNILKEQGLRDCSEIQVVNGISIYPPEYFCPLEDSTGILEKTENTVAIHWFSKTWWDKNSLKKYERAKFLSKLLGREFVTKCSQFKNKIMSKIKR